MSVQQIATTDKVDELMSALVLMAELLHKPHSADAFKVGLPLADNCMTPDMVVRACERVGFKAGVFEKALPAIEADLLPVILITQNGGAVVLNGRSQGVDSYHVTGFTAEGDRENKQLKHAELTALYNGCCVLINRDYAADELRDELVKPKRSRYGWFFSVLWQSRSIYRDVILASLMLNLFILANPLFTMNVYDRVVPNNAVETLWVLALGVGIVYLFDFVIKLMRNHFIEVAGKKADVLLSAKLFSKVMSLKMDVMPMSVGAFANNLKDYDGIKNFLAATTIATLIDLPFALLFLLVIYWLGGAIALAPAVASLLIIITGFFVAFSITWSD